MGLRRDKVVMEQNTLDAAIGRMHVLYDICDDVVVAFSGGKDSTVCLEVALKVAEERGKLPLTCFFFDEEAIPYDTEDYVRRRAQDPRIDLRWFCLPVRHLNACDKGQPFWSPWDPDEEDKWVRPMPPEAISIADHPWLREKTRLLDPIVGNRPTIPELSPFLMLADEFGTSALVMGLRTAESMARYRTMRSLSQEFMTGTDDHGRASYRHAFPIYDMTHEDVWRAIVQNDWDYNVAYDVMEMAGMSISEQRCAPPFGAEPITSLYRFRTCWPELWDRMVNRVDGANTASMYAHNTTMFTWHDKKPGQTWESFIADELRTWGEPMRSVMAKRIRDEISRHYKKFPDDPILPLTPHPTSGLTWHWLSHLAIRGDFKHRKMPPRPAPDARHLAAMKYEDERATLTDEDLRDIGMRPRRTRR